jgi:nucleoside diphosphate kinase
VVHQNEQWQVVPTKIEKITELTPVAQILKQNQNELALIIISPTLVSNHDFVFVIDEFNRSKFNIVALKKIRVDTDKLESLFKDLVPRTHNLEMLSNEFSRGDSVLLVLEKTRAIDEASELIGKFTIKIGLDWEKKKKKKN